jgi:hypothetical protein
VVADDEGRFARRNFARRMDAKAIHSDLNPARVRVGQNGVLDRFGRLTGAISQRLCQLRWPTSSFQAASAWFCLLPGGLGIDLAAMRYEWCRGNISQFF